MQHLRTKRLVVILLLPLFFVPCDDKEERSHQITQVSGTSDHKLEVYIENGTQLGYVDTHFHAIDTAIEGLQKDKKLLVELEQSSSTRY
jgi:hypothetical protein